MRTQPSTDLTSLLKAMPFKKNRCVSWLIVFFILFSGSVAAVAQAPTISSFSPSTGPAGTLVTITGTNLNSPTAFTIGGTAAIAVSNSDTTLVGMVMPGTVTGAISINTAGGTATSSGNFTVTATLYPGGQQGSKLVGTGSSGSTVYQGNSVSVSADGNTAIVGGSGDNSNQGAAWIYIRSGNTWSQQGNKLFDYASYNSYQGSSVALSADGNTAIVGGPGDDRNSGAAWVYTRSGSSWSQQGGKLVGSNASFGHQGNSVSLSADGNTAIVGGPTDAGNMGAAWVFTRSGSTWSQQGNKLVGTGSSGSTVYQGFSVSISADGNSAIVGGPMDNAYNGAAWVFSRSGSSWSQQGKLVGSGGVYSPWQGYSVSISGDGNTAIVGGPYDNQIYPNPCPGAAWVFTRSGSTWTQQGSKLVGTGNTGNANQGSSVSLSADGNTVIVGGFYDNAYIGAAWVYTRSGSTWSQQGSKLVGTGGIGYNRQGSSVSLSADGRTVMVGGSGDNTNKGASWVFVDCESPAINSQSTATQTQCIDGAFSAISVTTTGEWLSYQWYSNASSSNSGGTSLGTGNGAQTNTYTPQASVAGTLYYYCVVTNACGTTATSVVSEAFITNAATAIISQSTATQTQCLNGSFNAISVSATGPGLTYQWYSNSTNSNSGGTSLGAGNGAQTNSYTPQTAAGGTLYYYCIVTGTCGTATTTVSGAFITNATTISSQSTATQTQCISGTFAAITVTATGPGLTYQWYSNATNSNSGGTSLGTGNGAQTNSYTPQANVAGTLYYYCVVTGTCGTATSTVSGAFITNAATAISSQSTATQTQCSNGTFSAISVTATGTGTLTYQWYSNVSNSNSGGTSLGSGNGAQTNSYTPQTSAGGTLYYYCVVTGTCGTATSSVSGAFIVNPLLTVTSFSPNTGPAGTLVTITGTNLNNTSSFNIGGVPALIVSNTATSLVGMIMPNCTGTISITSGGCSPVSAGTFTITPTLYPGMQQGEKILGTGNTGAALQGTSVAVSADGNTAIVGGSGDNSSQGAVWVYTRSGSTWTQQGDKLVGTGNTGPAFQGCSVSLSADGNTAMVGGYADNSNMGAAWVFTRSGSTWSQQGAKLVGTGGSSGARQGTSVALSADGNTAMVGGPYDNTNLGATWVFTRSGSTWTQQGNKLVGTGSVGPTVYQGFSVSLSANGNTAIVGGNGDNSGTGAAWIFNRSGGIWTQTGNKLVGSDVTANAAAGQAVAISADGNTAIVGGVGDDSGIGAAWVYTYSGSTWTQQGNKLLGTGGTILALGCSVAISADGNTALVGGHNSDSNKGATWVYTRSGSTWSQQGSKLVGTGGTDYPQQGTSVALSADGNTAIVGGFSDNSDQGAAWVFVPCTGATINSQSTATQTQNINGTFDAISVTASGDGLTYQWYSNASNSNSGGTSLGSGNGAQTNSYTPQSATAGTLYYYCVVTGACGTATSAVTQIVTVTNTAVISVKVFLEGPYSGSAMSTTLNSKLPTTDPYTGSITGATIPASAVDWVQVELRQAASAAEATLETKLTGWPKSFFLLSNGAIVDMDGTSLPTFDNTLITSGNNLYVIVRHRNHIAIMSAVGMTAGENSYTYDFTAALSKAYGAEAGYKEIASGVFGMVAGDIDGDGNILGSDFISWALNSGFSSVYSNADLDFDTNILGSDFTKWAINSGMSNPITKSATLVESVLGIVAKYTSQVPGTVVKK